MSFCDRKGIKQVMITLKYTLRSILWPLSFIPYIFLFGVVSLATRAYLYLGYWPKPSHPDPKLLPFEEHHSLLWSILGLFGCSIVLVPILYFLNVRIWDSEKADKLALKVFVTGVILSLGLVFVPSINVVAWFLD